MTTTDERIDSLTWTENLLSDMLDAKDVPGAWKEQIRFVLRHYPWPMYLKMLRDNPPKGW